jgi:hypothetical protein
VGKNVTWHKGARYFLIKTYNKVTIKNRLIYATK